jgi:hypothetical protein
VTYLVQISDPDDLRVTIQVPGKYNPDILEDAKNRCVSAYKEALQARCESVLALILEDDEEESEEEEEAVDD